MIISYLQGGLGNQLFEIAASIGAAEWQGTEWRVQADFGYKNNDQFDGQKYFSLPQENYVDSYALPTYTEPYFHYYSIPEGSYELKGYFQSQRYFKHCQTLIRKYFSAPERIEQKIKWKYRDLLSENTCAVHVRRTDYIKLKDSHFNLFDTDYYSRAIEQVKLLHPDVHFVCFSDDPKWCKENIPADTFIKDEMPIEFHLMSYCKHFIMANSTFSWWASWLSANKNKLIIAPNKKMWFGERKRGFIMDDLYCANWIEASLSKQPA